MINYKEEKTITVPESKDYMPFETQIKDTISQNIQKEAEGWRIPVGGSIGTTATIFNNKIYFGACDKNFYCLSLNGKLIWKFATGGPILSSASIRDNIVFFGCDDGFLYALDAETGELKWKIRTGGDIYSCPAIVDGIIYFGSSDGYLYALNMDGKPLWKFLTGGRIMSDPAVVNDSIFFASYDRNFYSISADGKVLWKFVVNGPSGSAPTIANEKYEEVWSFQKYSTKDPGTISVKNGIVYFGAWNNHRYALNIDDGKLVWQFITGGITSSPSTIYKKIIFFGSFDTYFYALGARDGNLLWRVRTGSHIIEQKPTVYDNTIYFCSVDQHIYALSLEGKESWKFMTGGPIASSPIIYNDILYIGSWDTYFYAISLKDKKILWKFQTGFPFMSPVFDILEKIVKATEKRFTTWKPEIITATGKIYKPDITDSGFGTESESNPYLLRNTYSMGSPYVSKKKKKDTFFPGKF